MSCVIDQAQQDGKQWDASASARATVSGPSATCSCTLPRRVMNIILMLLWCQPYLRAVPGRSNIEDYSMVIKQKLFTIEQEEDFIHWMSLQLVLYYTYFVWKLQGSTHHWQGVWFFHAYVFLQYSINKCRSPITSFWKAFWRIIHFLLWQTLMDVGVLLLPEGLLLWEGQRSNEGPDKPAITRSTDQHQNPTPFQS